MRALYSTGVAVCPDALDATTLQGWRDRHIFTYGFRTIHAYI